MRHPYDALHPVIAGLVTKNWTNQSVTESAAPSSRRLLRFCLAWGCIPSLLALLILLLLSPAAIGAEGLDQDLPTVPVQVAAASDGSAVASMDLSDPTKFPFSSTGKWTGYLDFLGKPGTKRSLGQPDLFLPLLQNKSNMTFFNLRGQLQFDNTDVHEYNIGLGHRHMFTDWILGGYGYYDKRHTQFGNSYNQFTGGLEALSVDWAARINGYLPENKTETITSGATVSVIRPGDQIQVQIDGIVQEKALPGVDGEVGYLLPIPWKETYELRVYAGGYHFFGEDNFESVTGPRGRVEWRAYDLPILGPGSRFMMGVEAQWDEPRGSQAFGLASLRIPFDVLADKSKRKALKGLDRRMFQPVIRDVDVVTSQRDVTEVTAALNWQGKAFTTTQDIESMEDLGLAVTNNDGEVALLIAEGNPEDLEDMGLDDESDFRDAWDGVETLELGEDQTLTSAGKMLMVGYQSQYLGAGSVGYTPSGTPVGLRERINMGSGSHVNAMTLDVRDQEPKRRHRAISITGGGNHYVSNTTIAGGDVGEAGAGDKYPGAGLYIENSNLVTDDLTIRESKGDGLHAINSTVTFNGDTTIRLNQLSGVFADDSTLTFNGGTTTVSGNGRNGIQGSASTFDFNGSTTMLGNNNHYGMNVLGSTVTFTNANVTISNNSTGGIYASKTGTGRFLTPSTIDFYDSTTTISGNDNSDDNSFLSEDRGNGIVAVDHSTVTFHGGMTMIERNAKYGARVARFGNIEFLSNEPVVEGNGSGPYTCESAGNILGPSGESLCP